MNLITEQDKKAHSVREIGELWGVSESFLRGEIRKGNLRAKLVGRRVLVLASDAEEYFKSQGDWQPGVFQGARQRAIAA
jgi:hypothetical protein